jgi:uncharacterized membrane protein
VTGPRIPSISPEPVHLRSEFAGVLRLGVLVSAVLLLVGLARAVLENSVGIAGRTGGLPFAKFAADLGAGQPWAFLWLGVVVLAVTPVVRVAIALGNFASARDRDFVALTGFVLAVLLASVTVGVLA